MGEASRYVWARKALGIKERRLLVISEYFPPRVFGGGEVSAQLLARGLAEQGFEVWVLTTALEGVVEEEECKGVRVLRRLRSGPDPMSVWSNILRVLRLPRSIRREAGRLTAAQNFGAVFLLNSTSVVPLHFGIPTIAVINGYTPFCPKGNLFYREESECTGCAPGKFVGCITRSSYVGRSRMRWFLRFNPMFWLALYGQYWMRRRALRGVNRFVAISGFVERVLEGHGVDPECIERIYNVARIEDNEEVPQELAPIISGRRVTSIIGSLEKIKGIEMAMKAFAIWKSESDLLLLVGEGSERANLERIGSELGLVGNVHFAGQMDQRYLPFIYRRSAAVIVPSLWPEPFSRVVMEAAFFGTPLLASNRGGNRDLPTEHVFADATQLVAKLDDPPVPDFSPFDPDINLDRFVRLASR